MPVQIVQLPPDSGFRIRTIPSADPPHRSPYRLTPEEWEVYSTRRKLRRFSLNVNLPVELSLRHSCNLGPSGIR